MLPRDKLCLELSLLPPLAIYRLDCFVQVPRAPAPMALFPGGWCRAPLVVSSPRTSQPHLVCLQTLLSKYNQQYHKLFKDIPLEEVVLKGELSPRCGWTGAWRAWGPGPLLRSLQGAILIWELAALWMWLGLFSSKV